MGKIDTVLGFTDRKLLRVQKPLSQYYNNIYVLLIGNYWEYKNHSTGTALSYDVLLIGNYWEYKNTKRNNANAFVVLLIGNYWEYKNYNIRGYYAS